MLHRGAVIAARGEQPGRGPDQLRAAGAPHRLGGQRHLAILSSRLPNDRSFVKTTRYPPAVSDDRSAPAPERIGPLLSTLKQAHPEAGIALEFSTPLECVVATILSAQSTDVGVNLVTKDLFRKYRSPEDYLKVPEEELQRDIQSTGFFRQKTRALRGMSQKLVDDCGGGGAPTPPPL